MNRSIRAARILIALASLGAASAAMAQGPDAVAPKPVNAPPAGSGGDAPTMSNVDKPAPAAKPAAPAAKSAAAGGSGFKDIPFQKGDPEAPGNPEGDRRMHINVAKTWQKHWVDHGPGNLTDHTNRTPVVIGGTVY